MIFNFVLLPIAILAIGIFVIWLSIRRMRSPFVRTTSMWRRIIECVVLSVVVLAALIVVGTTSYSATAINSFWARNPAPGRMVDVGGHKMHIDCTGSGSPVLVLEAGGQNNSTIWRGVQPALSKTTTVCSYDRAGTGWSDTQPGPRDADHIATELHQLLAQAGINSPIVLMAHSIGGLFVRDYVTHYSVDVAGIVLVDSSTPFQDRNPALVRATPPKTKKDKVVDFVLHPWMWNLAVVVGTPRLLGMCGHEHTASEHIGKLQAEEICRLRTSAWDEIYEWDASSQETVNSGPFGALPILILSRDTSKGLPAKPPQNVLDRRNTWNQMQEDLKKLSTRSRRIVARSSAHQITLDRPDLIEKEVPIFIEEVRGSTPPPRAEGSTVTE